MTDDHKPLPVAGYTSQPDAKVALVNEFKADEERLLRKLDKMKHSAELGLFGDRFDLSAAAIEPKGKAPEYDQALLAEARKTLMVGFMLLNRAVFQPQRIKLPEDSE